MPRKSKSQPIASVAPGQPYGIAGDQQAAMKTVPLPNNQTIPEPLNASSPNPVAPPTATPNSPSVSLEDILGAAQASPTPGSGAFSAPTMMPNQGLLDQVTPPPTAPRTNPTIELLKTMAANAGNDPAILEIVNQLQMQRMQ